MNKLSSKKFGIASGITGVIVYILCYLLMTILGKETLGKLANLLFHGVDFSNILRMNIPIFETILGLVISFLFWGLTGYLLSFFYNKLNQ